MGEGDFHEWAKLSSRCKLCFGVCLAKMERNHLPRDAHIIISTFGVGNFKIGNFSRREKIISTLNYQVPKK